MCAVAIMPAFTLIIMYIYAQALSTCTHVYNVSVGWAKEQKWQNCEVGLCRRTRLSVWSYSGWTWATWRDEKEQFGCPKDLNPCVRRNCLTKTSHQAHPVGAGINSSVLLPQERRQRPCTRQEDWAEGRAYVQCIFWGFQVRENPHQLISLHLSVKCSPCFLKYSLPHWEEGYGCGKRSVTWDRVMMSFVRSGLMSIIRYACG